MSMRGNVVDLRSDTVTQPSPRMRAAMAAAVVGDDVMGEDPTVRALEARVAALTGKEAALFVASGTMANLVAVFAHAPRGSEIIADEESHLVLNEAGGAASLAGVMVRTLHSDPDAHWAPERLRAAVRDPRNPHHPPTSLVMLEDTHAHRMGRPLGLDYVRSITAWAHDAGLPVHVDGARIANAAVACGTDIATLLASVDTASICLSKGLGCPAGSVVVGPKIMIERAHRARKVLGGGQRQIGVLAAAGLVALTPGPEGMLDRLIDDHRRARMLADAWSGIPGVRLDVDRVRTNILILELEGPDPDRVIRLAREEGVLLMRYPGPRVRAVTHADVDDAAIAHATGAVSRAIAIASGRRSRPSRTASACMWPEH